MRRRARREAHFSTAAVYRKLDGRSRKKARGLVIPALGIVTDGCALEDDLRDELNIARFARTYGGSAVEVADGVGDGSEAAGVGAHAGDGVRGAVAADRADARSEVDAVEQVEDVRPQLNLHTFGNRDVFDE